ncbi:hypothetical protein BC936DRAFT_140073, partial [Jimgerdemannia flammicorona]
HAEFFHQVPDEFLSDLLPVAKKVAIAIGAPHYNILQFVPHVHFHIIPKPNEEQGLGVGWPHFNPTQDELAAKARHITEAISKFD